MRSLTGILLINLGTPAAPSVGAVRKYLRQFLSDPRVVELPSVLRWLLLNLVILPRRAKQSAHAYASIWQPTGSPLLVNSKMLQSALQQHLGANYVVALGMRYGEPTIAEAIAQLEAAKVQQLIVVPLFPQYASAATGSALEQTLKILARKKIILPCKIINEFYQTPAFIQASAASIQPYLQQDYDFLLLSYHGLPERQLINLGIDCYKTKCLQTGELIAHALTIPKSKWSVSFQSRLGKLPWIQPYTDQMLITLSKNGVKRLVIACPSFVVDCLETLEEIGMRAKEQWLALGGESLQLVPCLNAQPVWISALQTIIHA